MDQEKIGQYIKKIRLENGYTQAGLARELGVSYQAVSKWELGKSIPDLSVLHMFCQKFDLNVDDLLNLHESPSNKTKKNKKLIFILLLIGVISCIFVFFWFKKINNNFEFKTIVASCNNFKIIGSAAYNSNKTSIFISNINYCGKKNDIVYSKITCDLYEKYGDAMTLISACDEDKDNITLDKYLSNITINVDNYSAVCKRFAESSLYLEINAYLNDGTITKYEVPLTLKDNC